MNPPWTFLSHFILAAVDLLAVTEHMETSCAAHGTSQIVRRLRGSDVCAESRLPRPRALGVLQSSPLGHGQAVALIKSLHLCHVLAPLLPHRLPLSAHALPQLSLIHI